MFVLTLKFDRKKAVFCVVMAALILFGIVMLAGAHSKAVDASPENEIVRLKSDKKRVEYLEQCGWEVEAPALTEEKVIIPRSFSQVFENYNELQISQGFDLSHYCECQVDLYTYRVHDENSDDNLIAQMYVYNGELIGGDVHSTALDGFMCGLKKE